MRLRFFGIILCVLLLTAGALIYLHIYFFVNEPLRILDRQILAEGKALAASDLGDLRQLNFEQIDQLISKISGDDRIGKIYLIRDESGKVAFRSDIIPLLQMEFPRTPERITINNEKYFVHLFNFPLSRYPGWTLQIGGVLDPRSLDWNIITARMVTYILIVVLAALIVSAGLSVILLSPLKALSIHLARATADLRNPKDIGPLPPSLLKYSNRLWAGADDFGVHIAVVQKLIDRINVNHRITKSWTYQMAHELKTPLSILGLQTEKIQGKYGVSQDDLAPLTTESTKISETINSFLGWAELENSKRERPMYVLRLGAVARSVCDRLDRTHPARIEFDMDSDPAVVANPPHLEQVITNLLTNALNYSENPKPVTVKVSERTITFIDRGPGIPAEVVSRIGEPFNFGDAGKSKGNGLGLAWVKSICASYSWEFQVLPSSAGSKITISFPQPGAEST